MRFREIPQFTGAGKYKADYEMKSIVRAIEEFEEELGLQMVPDFQRGHVWTEEQQISYVEFLLQGGSTGRDFYFNHPQWNEVIKVERGEFVCVDGLQRITALKRFLKNEIRVFGLFLREFEDDIKMVRGKFTIHINDLKTKEEVLKWYLEMNSGGTPHSKEEIERVQRMLKNEQQKEIHP